jgi:hypothetical protein
MVVNKGGQFFLLSSVIISAIVLSFGAIANGAGINPEPENLKEFSYEMKRESGAMIEYDIYNGFPTGVNLSVFIQNISEDIRDKDPYANFMFIYGNSSQLYLKNYGSELIYACASGDRETCEEIEGAGTQFNGTLSYGSITQNVSWVRDDSSNLWEGEFNSSYFGINSTLDVIIAGDVFSFPIEESYQVIFVIQKEVENENFVSVR